MALEQTHGTSMELAKSFSGKSKTREHTVSPRISK